MTIIIIILFIFKQSMTNLDEFDENSLRDMYDSMKGSIIDVAAMDFAGISEMKKFIYNYGKTGDLLRINVSIGDEKQIVTDAVIMENGSSVHSIDTNIFLPFEGKDEVQEVTIASSTFRYENSTVEGSITVDGNVIGFGTPFMVGGRRVVLAKGSVVLLLEDTLIRDFPEEGVQEEIIFNDGTLAIGDVTTTGVVQLERKADSGDTTVDSYVFFHDGVTDERACVSKRTHTVDFFETSGNSAIKLGYVDNSSYRTIEDVLDYSPSSVGIRSISGNGVESVATIDVDGLSFNSDDSSVIMGDYRIKYDEGTDTLQIQYFATFTGEYITKREFGR